MTFIPEFNIYKFPPLESVSQNKDTGLTAHSKCSLWRTFKHLVLSLIFYFLTDCKYKCYLKGWRRPDAKGEP